MILGAKKAAAICICISLFAFCGGYGAAQTAAAAQPSGALPGGGMYIVHPDPASATAAIELWFRAPGDGYDGRYPGIARLAITAAAASAPPHGTSLAELVNQYGGTLTLQSYPDIAMVGVSVPALRAPAVVRAVTTAYFRAALSPDAIKTAMQDTALAVAQNMYDPQRILQDRLFAGIFTAGPAHVPPLPAAVADLSSVPAAAVKAFATRAFRQQNGILALTGDVSPALLRAVVPGPPGPPMDAPIDSPVAATPAGGVATGPEPGLGVAWVGPPIDDAKASAALDFVADYLFDSRRGIVARQAAARTDDLYVTGQFITLHHPGVLVAMVFGPKAGAMQPGILDAVDALRAPLGQAAFDAARNAFEYQILAQTQTPSARADNFGWYAAEGSAADAPGSDTGTYLDAVASLDPGYVASIVRRYLQHPALVRLQAQPSLKGAAS